jgi:nanoRNase/pAp phosphatase (c-di-AMP/oligoRNAs hydrolase)
MRIGEGQFAEHIRRFNHVLYLCHRNADPDAIGSSFALARAFGGSMGAVDDLSRTGASLAHVLGADLLIDPPLEDYDLVVLVDTSVAMQVGQRLPACYGLVDHHLDAGLLDQALFFIQRPARSTAEIVWNILKASGIKPGREAALGLLAGMISDTGRFKRASPETFAAASELLAEGGFDYEEALEALAVPVSLSQRMAVLKAASRCQVEHQGRWLIAWTSVNSFEGSASMALVELGADVALVAGRHGSRVRVSGRSGREANRSGLNLAEILGRTAKEFGGEGGGHRSAAAMEATGEAATILAACRRKVAASLLQEPVP